jgi:hypothetical protein
MCSFVRFTYLTKAFRGRPFNLQGGRVMVFCFVQKFFSDNTRVRIFIFFCGAEPEIFFQNLLLGYMTKTLNQIIIFFPPPKSEYFFQQHWESEYIFRKKTITPPFKLNGCSLIMIEYYAIFFFIVPWQSVAPKEQVSRSTICI